MARLDLYSTTLDPDEEPDPTTTRGMGLMLIRIAEDLEARKDSEPREALLAAADGLDKTSFSRFASAARRLAALDDADISAGAQEMATTVVHLMTQFALAIREARAGGNAQVDMSVSAHKPHWAKHL